MQNTNIEFTSERVIKTESTVEIPIKDSKIIDSKMDDESE